MFQWNKVALGSNQLRRKALIALEEAAQECRVRSPRRTFALRFALAYLWSTRPGDREPYDAFWMALAGTDMWRFQSADQALNCIYRQLGVARDDVLAMTLWKRQWGEQRGGNAEPPNGR